MPKTTQDRKLTPQTPGEHQQNQHVDVEPEDKSSETVTLTREELQALLDQQQAKFEQAVDQRVAKGVQSIRQGGKVQTLDLPDQTEKIIKEVNKTGQAKLTKQGWLVPKEDPSARKTLN